MGRAVVGRRQLFTVTVRSTGSGPLHLSRPTLGGAGARWWRVVSRCPSLVRPGHSCTFTLAFQPGVAVAPSAKLFLRTGAGIRSIYLTSVAVRRTVKGAV